MNSLKPIAGTAKQFAPHRPEGADVPQSLNPSHGTPLANLRAEGEAGVTPLSSVSPTFPCRHCDGEGEAEYMGLTEDRYHWQQCHVCEGSRVEAPYCDVCQSNLTADLFCVSCDDWASLVYVERIAPGRVAL